MTNRLLRKYINSKPSRLLFAAVLLLFVFHTSPGYCGACMIGTCNHGALISNSSGDEDCHGTVQETGCCANEAEKESKYIEPGTGNCPPCHCLLKGASENPIIITLISSGLYPVLFVVGILDDLETFSDRTAYSHSGLPEPQVRNIPIYVLNNTFLI